MMRYLIRPSLARYRKVKARYFGDYTCVEFPLLHNLEENESFLKNLARKYSSSLLKRKRSFPYTTSVIGILSGCCFSKSSNEDDSLMKESETLIRTKNKRKSSSDSLDISAHRLISEQQNETISEVNNRGDTLLLSAQTENISVPEIENKVIDIEPINLSECTSESVSDHITSNFKKKKRRKLDLEVIEETLQDENDKEDVCRKKKIKQKEPRIQPNYFVAFQISNPEIHERLAEVQKHILEHDERLAKSAVSVLKSHITLMVMHLASDEEYSRAFNVLKVIHKEMNISMAESPLKLKFQGIGHFRNQVIFAKISEGDGLSRLHGYADSVENHFKNAEILSTDGKRSFNPHLTLMKLSKDPKLYRKGIKKINSSFYEMYKDQLFGSQIITSIQLLSMLSPADENGYYAGDELAFDLSSED